MTMLARTQKIVVILQSNYIPWKGYFDLIGAADEFLIYDEVQFTKNDWRNRNRIILNTKPHWLTIAIKTAGLFGLPVASAEVSDRLWAAKHWATLHQAYRRAPHWKEISPFVESAYQEAGNLSRLTDINELFLRRISEQLGITTPILRADLVLRTTDDPTLRLVEICKARGATDYLSGPAARDYLDPAMFAAAGINLHFADYSGYPAYQQTTNPFQHGVSILDTLCQCGVDATRAQLKSTTGIESLLARS